MSFSKINNLLLNKRQELNEFKKIISNPINNNKHDFLITVEKNEGIFNNKNDNENNIFKEIELKNVDKIEFQYKNIENFKNNDSNKIDSLELILKNKVN